MEDTKTFDAVRELANLSKLVNLRAFYNVSISPSRGDISLQGEFNSETIKAAKALGIILEFDNNYGMLRGVEGTLRITLT